VKLSPLRPRAHLFVCQNRREPGHPLGEGCGDAGARSYDALKREVSARGVVREVWVAKSGCLGLCPKSGCAVAISPAGRYVEGVAAADAPALIEWALREG
jgi:(2Fe-2S) ferredoxin